MQDAPPSGPVCTGFGAFTHQNVYYCPTYIFVSLFTALLLTVHTIYTIDDADATDAHHAIVAIVILLVSTALNVLLSFILEWARRTELGA